MVTLGDTLAGRGQLYAAQFCYIVSAVEFGTYTKKSSKVGTSFIKFSKWKIYKKYEIRKKYMKREKKREKKYQKDTQ